MGWFDKQVRTIKQKDQEAFEESIFQLASVVLGRHDRGEAAEERILTKAALDEILKYYHFKPTEVPSNVKDAEEQLDYVLRPKGIMRRNVVLKENWYKDSYAPLLVYTKEDNRPIALIPHKFMGYDAVDTASGRKIKVNKKITEQFKDEAICFYKPMPMKELGIKDLLIYMKECLSMGDVTVFLVMTLIVTLVGMISPLLTKTLTGNVLESKNLYFLLGIAVFMIATAISSTLFESVKNLGTNRFQTKTSQAVEAALMARVMNLPADFFRTYSSGELSSRLTQAQQLCNLILNSVFSTGITSIASLLYISQIAIYAPALALPAIVIILLTIAINIVTVLMEMRIRKAIMLTGAKNSGLSFALINGIQKIKLAGAEKRAFAKWAGAYAKEARYTYDLPLFLKVNGAITKAVSLLGTIVIYYIAVSTNVNASEYLAFNVAYGSVMGGFTALTGVAMSIARIKPTLEMVEPILKAVPESSENKAMVTNLSGNIELNNVYFRYKENMPYVINGMSLKIKSGEYIAIVGTTGCGKSTLMRLLLGFETPEKGAIYYDGSDMSKLDLKSLRQKIGAVTQDGGLFQGDIFSNIVISAPKLTLDEAWEAAELAGIADDIRDMPMGMSTCISEGQGGISGGQKQRLMIARAIAPKPKILMFDEATSALDNKTQKQVSESLDKLKCTRIVIAHRLSTIKHCDRILVLDKGKIAEDGNYEELIAKGGLFAELVERQRLE